MLRLPYQTFLVGFLWESHLPILILTSDFLFFLSKDYNRYRGILIKAIIACNKKNTIVKGLFFFFQNFYKA